VVLLVGAAMLAAMGALFLLMAARDESPDRSVPPVVDVRPPEPKPTPVAPPTHDDGILPVAAPAAGKEKSTDGKTKEMKREELRVLLQDVISVVDRLNSYGKTVEDLIELARDPAVQESLERMKNASREGSPSKPAPAPKGP
jgi:hypothetical protein